MYPYMEREDIVVDPNDERFFPFLPFLGGLAVGGLLGSRPFYGGTPYAPMPYPVPYPVNPYVGYSGGIGYGGMGYDGYATPLSSPYTFPTQQLGLTENINIYQK